MKDAKDSKYYTMLRDKFILFWAENDIPNIDGPELEKAFLAYTKGFTDGLGFISSLSEEEKRYYRDAK